MLAAIALLLTSSFAQELLARRDAGARDALLLLAAAAREGARQRARRAGFPVRVAGGLAGVAAREGSPAGFVAALLRLEARGARRAGKLRLEGLAARAVGPRARVARAGEARTRVALPFAGAVAAVELLAAGLEAGESAASLLALLVHNDAAAAGALLRDAAALARLLLRLRAGCARARVALGLAHVHPARELGSAHLVARHLGSARDT